jgi:predicted membrane chloride channel (bestrophin family)
MPGDESDFCFVLEFRFESVVAVLSTRELLSVTSITYAVSHGVSCGEMGIRSRLRCIGLTPRFGLVVALWRVSGSYSRYWEGRKVWEKLHNKSRDLSR